MANSLRVADGKPAQAVGLAVGSVDPFEEMIFSPRRPARAWGGEESDEYLEWRTRLLAIAGDLETRHMAIGDRLKPLGEHEPDCSGALSNKLGDLLRPIGAKIAPHLSGEQATAWRKAMVMALSDLPPDVSLTATRAAIHEPMKFLSDVEMAVRKLASPTISILNLGRNTFHDIAPELPLPGIHDKWREAEKSKPAIPI